jgi:hypothetical protein
MWRFTHLPAGLHAENRVGTTDRQSAGSRRRGTARDDRIVQTWEWHSCWRTGTVCDIDDSDNAYRGQGAARYSKTDRRQHFERRFYGGSPSATTARRGCG